MARFLTDGVIDWNKTVPERQSDGTVHFYDMDTGALLSIMGDKALVSRSPVQINEHTREDGTVVFIQTGIAVDDKITNSRIIPYSKTFAEVLCSRIASGKSLKAISEEPGMPSYSTFVRWRREHREFEEMLAKAYEDQSDYRAEKILEEIDTASEDPDALNKVRLKLDATKWITQVNRPSKYSPRTKVMGDSLSPLQVVIETGIRRAGDEGYNIDETAKLRSVTPTEGDSGEVVEHQGTGGLLEASEDSTT